MNQYRNCDELVETVIRLCVVLLFIYLLLDWIKQDSYQMYNNSITPTIPASFNTGGYYNPITYTSGNQFNGGYSLNPIQYGYGNSYNVPHMSGGAFDFSQHPGYNWYGGARQYRNCKQYESQNEPRVFP